MIELGWNGVPLADPLAFDFETDIADLKTTVPCPVVMSLHDGHRSILLAPHQLDDFVRLHRDHRWFGFNVSFDWWVYYQAAGPAARRDLIRLVDQGRLHDAMYLEMLIRLAAGDDNAFFRSSLKKASAAYLGRELSKDAEIREGFDRYQGLPLGSIPIESVEYAIQDAVATYDLTVVLREKAASYVTAQGLADDFGLLTEGIQVKAAIALAQMTRNGLRLDSAEIDRRAAVSQAAVNEALVELEKFDPSIVKRYKRNGPVHKAGEPMKTKTGQLQLSTATFTEMVGREAEARGIKLPRTEKANQIQLTAEVFSDYHELLEVPAIKAWVDYHDATKVLQFLVALQGKSEIHPSYDVLKRTGRTSSYDINVQQMPREAWFRALFLARPGHQLITSDYAFIELRTLAAVIENEGKRSVLGEVIRQGVDPHAYTASVVRGVPLAEFMATKQLDPKHFKLDRQAAKALNFGIPGGLRPRKLTAYAKQNYGVVLDMAKATELWDKLVYQVYPELEGWLADTLHDRLGASLGVPPARVKRFFPPPEDNPYARPEWSPLARMMSGERTNREGVPWSPFFVEDTWVALESISEKADLAIRKLIRSRAAGPELYDRLFGQPAVTLTGRVRKKVAYGEYRNTKFQGLAADGAKLALWEILKDELAEPGRYRLAAFAHDEIVVEVPDDGEESIMADTERVVGRMVAGMSEAIQSDLPIAAEAVHGKYWVKA